MITEIIIFLWGHTELLEKSWNSKINCQNLTGQICLADLREGEEEQEKHEEKKNPMNVIIDISLAWSDCIHVVTFACLQCLQFSRNIYDFWPLAMAIQKMHFPALLKKQANEM